MYAGLPLVLTLIGPNWIGMWGGLALNSEASLQVTRPEVLAGTRFGPCISTQVLGAMTDGSSPETLTDVMVGRVVPGAGNRTAPEPVRVNAFLEVFVSVIGTEPLAPANVPLPPITVVGRVMTFVFRLGMEKKAVRESLPFGSAKTAVPCPPTKSVEVMVAFRFTLVPLTVPVPVTKIVTTGAPAAM